MLKENDKVEFTEKGFQDVLDSLTDMPQDERYSTLELVCTYMRN